MKLTKDIALEFVKDSIKESGRPNYPFRSRYRHTLRVLMWVKRLQKVLGGDLDVLTYSAIFHDCDWNGKENHAITSYRTAKAFLNQFDLEDEFKYKVLEGIKYHNRNETTGLCKESYILMDADELDEVGAICIIWDVLAENHEKDKISYKSAIERTIRYLPEMQGNLSKFHFEHSLQIYRRKLNFMKQFIEEAKEELEIEMQ